MSSRKQEPFSITWCPIKGVFRQKKLSVQAFNSVCIYNYNHVQKSWDTFAFVRLFFQFTHDQPLPPPHKQRWTRVGVYPEFFRVSTLYRVGGGRTAKKKSKKMPNVYFIRASEITKNYEYRITALGLLSRSVHEEILSFVP